jgi:hypothetical protein
MPGLLRGVARTAVVAGTASAVAGRVNRRQQRRWAEQDAQEYAQGSPQQYDPQFQEQMQPQGPAGDLTDDQIAQLEKLGELKDKGVLTQVEFDRKKGEILGF